MEENEFVEIVRGTKGLVLSAIEKHLAARFYHAIDDVVQETYLKAYKGLKNNKFRGDSAIQTWLYAIARNESLRMTQKLKREEEKFRKAIIKRNMDTEDNQFREDEEKFSSGIYLKKLIMELPEKYRCVMELVALGLSEKQISQQLEIKRGTVKSRASRGRELMLRLANGGINQ